MKYVRFSFATALTLILLFTSLGAGAISSSAYLQPQNGRMIDIRVAGFVAQSVLPIFYEGNWKYFDHLVYHDLDGKPVTFAFVFQRPPEDPSAFRESAEIQTFAAGQLETLEESMRIMREMIADLSEQIAWIEAYNGLANAEKTPLIQELTEEKNKAQEALYGIGEFATVVTGARVDMPLILKCHEGLPPAFVKERDALALAYNKDASVDWHIGQLIYLDRFTEAVELVQGLTDGRGPVSSEAVVVNLRTRTIAPRSDLRRQFNQAQGDKKLNNAQLFSAEVDTPRQRYQLTWEVWKQKARDNASRIEAIVQPIRTDVKLLKGELTKEK